MAGMAAAAAAACMSPAPLAATPLAAVSIAPRTRTAMVVLLLLMPELMEKRACGVTRDGVLASR
jgi:hypothetical protein